MMTSPESAEPTAAAIVSWSPGTRMVFPCALTPRTKEVSILITPITTIALPFSFTIALSYVSGKTGVAVAFR